VTRENGVPDPAARLQQPCVVDAEAAADGDGAVEAPEVRKRAIGGAKHLIVDFGGFELCGERAEAGLRLMVVAGEAVGGLVWLAAVMSAGAGPASPAGQILSN
jgi:hypothetical protein